MKIADIDKLPYGLMKSLGVAALAYTDPVDLYHCIALDADDSYCGVIGDGANGSYEWFIWRKGKLETSNVGYGIIAVALRDVLSKVEPVAIEDIWKRILAEDGPYA